jgi:O-antigen/teichoic acid export membrane protein
MSLAPLATAWLSGPSLEGLLVTVFVVRLLATACTATAAVRLVPLVSAARAQAGDASSLLRFGGWVAFGGIAAQLLMSSDKFILAWQVGAAAASIYIIGSNLVSRFLLLPQSLSTVLVPNFASRSTAEQIELEKRSLRMLAYLAAPICIGILLFLPTFLRIWLGQQVGSQVAVPAGILLCGLWFNACSHVMHARLQGRGRPELIAKVTLAQLLPFWALVYIAVIEGGIVGASLAFTLRAALETFIFLAVSRNFVQLVGQITGPAFLVATATLLYALLELNSVQALIMLAILAALAVFSLVALLRKDEYLSVLPLTWQRKIRPSPATNPL